MLIFTARIPKRRLMAGGITVLCCCAVVLVALLASLGRRSAAVNSMAQGQTPVSYLQQLGWQVEEAPLSTQELLVPETFDQSYADYLSLQEEQGFDLTPLQGKKVEQSTYQILNYPGGVENAQAVLLIHGGEIVGGHIQAADGSFVHSLSYPTQSSNTDKLTL